MQLFARRSLTLSDGFSNGYDGALTRTEASVRVGHDSALSDDGVLAAVSLIAGDIAGLPMRALSTDESGLTQPLARQPSWLEAPDPLDMAITDVAHKTQVALSVLLAGNAYVLCEPNVFRPVKLTVLNPLRIQVIKPSQERLFRVMGRSSIFEDWTPQDEVLSTLSSAQVLHIPYMLRPGRLEGLSPIDAQAGNVGISIAMRKWVETFFGKGGQVAGMVSLPAGSTTTEAQQVEDRIATKWSSWRRAGRIGVLNGGATWVKTGLTPQDADLEGLWRRQLEVAARIYGIPPFMIGSQEPAGVAYASSVERAQHYIDHCLARYTRPIEKAYSRLVPGDGRLSVPHSNTEVRFVFDAFLRGDPKARWEMYGVGLDKKGITIGEVRAKENLPQMSTYSQEYLDGPDGLFQSPNNNARPEPVEAPPPADPPPAPTPAPAPPAQRSMEPWRAIQLERLERQMGDMQSSLRMLGHAAPPSVTVNVPEQTINVATPAVQVDARSTVNVPEAVVNVSTPEQPAPVVNVTTPDVHVDNVVNVPAVQDINIRSLPAQSTSIQRDPQGRIKGAQTA